MTKHKITRDAKATTIIIEGRIKNPEPQTAIIKFPGGFVEVTRTSDNQYWAHTHVDGDIVDSRIDYTPKAWREHYGDIPPIPKYENIQNLSVRISSKNGGE